jgi:hypothetical protein
MCPSSPAGGNGPVPVAAVAKGTTPERMGESVAAAEAAGRSGAALEAVGPRSAVLEQGLKRVAPELGTSDRPVKKAWVHSKM